MLVKNAFSVLINSSQVDELPKRIVAHNRKDHLYNDLNGWNWHDSGSTLEARFLKQLRYVLWYIDDHHSVFESRPMAIPDMMQSFYG